MKHILIDYENIQPKNFEGIGTDACHVWLFLGINQQKNLPLELVETLLKFDNKNVHIIKMQHAGKNALDFYLSFYLGKIFERDPQANIYILARDSGYDVLVEHLNTVYEGLDIVRLADTNQLNLDYELEIMASITAPLIEKSQIIIETSKAIIEDNQSKSCHNGIYEVLEKASPPAQSIADKIPKALIHDCYIFVFDNIVNRKVFLPNYKSNLLYWMQKYVPVSVLNSLNHCEQDYIFEQVFEKFTKAGLITLDEKNEKLSYKVDAQGILDLVTQKVLLSKAKTVDGLHNVIEQKLASYRQANDEAQVKLVIQWLKTQGLIKQDNQSICYRTLTDITVNTNKKPATDSNKSKPIATIYQRAIASIQSRPISARPAKKLSLSNYLKSHLRNDDPKVIDNLIKQLVNNKMIVISDTQKLTYKI